MLMRVMTMSSFKLVGSPFKITEQTTVSVVGSHVYFGTPEKSITRVGQMTYDLCGPYEWLDEIAAWSKDHSGFVARDHAYALRVIFQDEADEVAFTLSWHLDGDE